MKYISLYGLADRRMEFPTNLPYFQFLYNFSERRDYEKSLRGGYQYVHPILKKFAKFHLKSTSQIQDDSRLDYQFW